MQQVNHPCCQALHCVPGPILSHQFKNITPSYLLSPVLLHYHFFLSIRSFASAYKNVVCSGLLNLLLNPHLQSQVCLIFVLLFTKNKQKILEIHVYLCCLYFLSSILSTHSDQTFSPTALLKLPLSWYQCSPPCHVQRSFLSLIFLLAASGTVDLPSSLKQSPLDSGLLLTILLSLAKFSSYFLQVCPMAFSCF